MYRNLLSLGRGEEGPGPYLAVLSGYFLSYDQVVLEGTHECQRWKQRCWHEGEQLPSLLYYISRGPIFLQTFRRSWRHRMFIVVDSGSDRNIFSLKMSNTTHKQARLCYHSWGKEKERWVDWWDSAVDKLLPCTSDLSLIHGTPYQPPEHCLSTEVWVSPEHFWVWPKNKTEKDRN